MTIPNLQIRRANVEDLPRLIPLWKEENLPWAELEKRFKEFQVAAGEGGELLGALGMQIAGLEGCLYGEVFLHPEQADELRDQLWERMQVIAKNHGIFRVWTQLATPFWDHNGFNPANAELLAKRPAAFPDDAHAWLFIQLREEPVGIPPSIEKEFALFKEAERARTEVLAVLHLPRKIANKKRPRYSRH